MSQATQTDAYLFFLSMTSSVDVVQQHGSLSVDALRVCLLAIHTPGLLVHRKLDPEFWN